MNSEVQEKQRQVIVKEKSPEVIGRYLDVDIHKSLELDDGRHFVFESIAVKGDVDHYMVDFPASIYMIFQNLLYRQVGLINED